MNTSKSSAGVALKRSSVIAVVLLSLLTGGFYTAIWYLRRRKGLELARLGQQVGRDGPGDPADRYDSLRRTASRLDG